MKYISMNYIITGSNSKKGRWNVIKEDAFHLKKQGDSDCSALLVYRCAECDTIVATTTAGAVFDATASQIAAESETLLCSKCENKY
jgi:hypothetical protein